MSEIFLVWLLKDDAELLRERPPIIRFLYSFGSKTSLLVLWVSGFFSFVSKGTLNAIMYDSLFDLLYEPRDPADVLLPCLIFLFEAFDFKSRLLAEQLDSKLFVLLRNLLLFPYVGSDQGFPLTARSALVTLDTAQNTIFAL